MGLRKPALSACLVAAFLLPTLSLADAESARLNRKIQQVMLLNQILPVVFTKPQLKQLLPVIEKAREAEADLAAKELKLLKKSEGKLDNALDQALKKGRIVTGKEMDDIQKVLSAFSITRKMMVQEQSENVRLAMVKICNKGQLKGAAQSFDPRWFDRTLDPDKLNEEVRLRMFIRLVLLDPEAYPLLVQLSR